MHVTAVVIILKWLIKAKRKKEKIEEEEMEREKALVK
jgi:hypothetical protein